MSNDVTESKTVLREANKLSKKILKKHKSSEGVWWDSKLKRWRSIDEQS